ncbi:DUF3054 domain-containing protein [Nocardia blacklockiae]|uniref:DUF3054 domain-containing protein n=1 Tax=Nocardia blacklockiae TaxID=480036 RepID=UPI001894056E|nr:DUF3054 domain-containing protein [Nocardia blacklockiae]MBF6176177.1 DUF3054 domain-containing protein [Nocardia blacklockiae]
MRKLVPYLVDALLVIVFCAIGRRSHDEAVLAGLARTVWPFGVGLILGWLLAAALTARTEFTTALRRFDPRPLWPTGVVVWLSTLIIGMLLRVLSGQGTATSFIIVAATVLAVFLLGWRAIYRILPAR